MEKFKNAGYILFSDAFYLLSRLAVVDANSREFLICQHSHSNCCQLEFCGMFKTIRKVHSR